MLHHKTIGRWDDYNVYEWIKEHYNEIMADEFLECLSDVPDTTFHRVVHMNAWLQDNCIPLRMWDCSVSSTDSDILVWDVEMLKERQ